MTPKPKRPVACYTLAEIAEAWIEADYLCWKNATRAQWPALQYALRRIAREKKGKKEWATS